MESKRKIQTEGEKEAAWCVGKMLNQPLDPCVLAPGPCVFLCDLGEIPERPLASIQMRGGIDGVSFVWRYSGPVLPNCRGAEQTRESWSLELGVPS